MTSSITLKNLFDRSAFLLGAGGSMDAGCLSSKQMLASLKNNLLKAAREKGVAKDFLQIYDFILQSLAYQLMLKSGAETKISDLSNIEDFVAILRQMLDREYIVPPPLIGNWNSKITSWEHRNEAIFNDFLTFVYDKLVNEWTRFDVEKAKSLLAPIRQLLQSPEPFDFSIFSLNYDLVFESTFNAPNEKLVEVGFSQSRWHGDFENPQNPAKIRLYKLHGSVNWFFDQEEEEVKEGIHDEVRPLIVFGSGPKIQSYDPFLTLLSRFREKLKEASLFVVIGYSFQDRYINNILIQSLNSGINKKMLVIDPGLDDDPMKFIERVEKFQGHRSMNEIISLTKISPSRVSIIKKTAKAFFEEYFANDAAALREILGASDAEERVFGDGPF